MSIAIITGSAGLIGSEACIYFSELGLDVHGIDNDMRSRFFGESASTAWNVERLEKKLETYSHHSVDIRDRDGINELFERFGSDISLIVHTAAQPSHDWAAREPFTDFDINATGTLNLLEATRQHAPEAVFIFTSTNKVYGDTPNQLPLQEQETRYEIDPSHPYQDGIKEDMSIDQCLHSLFGASKVAADVMVQEYGALLRHENLVFSRRYADRSAALGDEAARLFGLRDALHHDRHALHDFWLQGQAGARRYSQQRPYSRLR